MTAIGMMQATLDAIGEADTEIGGRRQTRLTAAAAPGNTTLAVESTFDWPDSGKITVEGIVYRYGSKTLTTFADLTHVAAGVTVANVKRIHNEQATVVDLSREYSGIDLLRQALFVDFAEGADLNAVGRNLNVLRLPFLKSDDQFRDVVKAMGYNPRATIYGLDLLLTALVGAGNYEIYENLITNPNEVQITLTGAAAIETISAGKTFLADSARSYISGVSSDVFDLETEVERSQVASFQWQPEDVHTDTRTALPSAATQELYPGIVHSQWTYLTGSVNEAAQVAVLTADGGCIEITDSGSGLQHGYTRSARVDASEVARISVLMAVPTGTTLTASPFQWVIGLADLVRVPLAGVVADTASTFKMVFTTTAGAQIGTESVILNRDAYYDIEVRKSKDDVVEVYVDGVLKMSEPYASFSAATGLFASAAFFWGVFLGSSGQKFRVRSITTYARKTQELWSQEGALGSVATSSADLTITAPGVFVAGDVGKTVFIRGSATANPQGGSNNGRFVIASYTSALVVGLTGVSRTNGTVESANPTQFEASSPVFNYPDDLGKQVVVTNSTLGNNGTYTITAILEDGSGTDLSTFDTVLPVQATTVVLSGAAFTTETGLDWRLDPVFVTESSLDWELVDAGDVDATPELTRRRVLPFESTDGIRERFRLWYSPVLSGQFMASNALLNGVIQESPTVLYEYYPFYVTDPLAFIRNYLDAITAAGVIPTFTIE